MAPCLPLLMVLLVTSSLHHVTPKVIDLSHELKNSTFYFTGVGEGAAPYNRGVLFRGDLFPGVYIDTGHMSHTEHTSTHLDAPSHYSQGAPSASDVSVEATIADGVMVDCAEEAAQNGSYLVTVEKLQAWEAKHGVIPQEAAVIFNFNWSQKYETDFDAYRGSTGDNLWAYTFPTISKEAGRWLFDNRNPKILALDGLSPDPFSIGGKKVDDLPNHVLYMGSNKIFVENLKAPYRLPARGFRFHATPARYSGASGSPVRAYAILDDEDNNGAARMGQNSFGLVVSLLTSIVVFWFH